VYTRDPDKMSQGSHAMN